MSEFRPDFDRLPVPDHGPGFWDRVEGDLRQGEQGRRVPGWVWAPVAAALAIVVGIGTSGLLGGDPTEPVPVGTADTTVTTAAPTTTTSTSMPEFLEDGLAAPWELEPLPVAEVPGVLVDEWRVAENRTWCRAVFPESLLARTDVRAANFSGGWGIAFDSPTRSALGVAGAAVTPLPDQATRWPNRIRFADGTVFGWGGEGLDESNPKRLGELVLPGQGCVYQLWSSVGDEMLVEMAKSLRSVEGLDGSEVELRGVNPVEEMGPAPWDTELVETPEWAVDLASRFDGPLPVFEVPVELAGAEWRTTASSRGVAWDLPDGPGHDAFNRPCNDCGRGVIGIDLILLGSTGSPETEPEPGTRRLAWDDGSTAVVGYYTGWNALPPDEPQSYDPETGEPVENGYRALITIPGVGTFDLWSHLGEDHLLELISSIRITEN